MEISYELTRKDLYEAGLASRNRGWRICVLGGLAASNFVFVTVCFIVIGDISPVTMAAAAIALVVFWAYFFWGQMWWAARNQYRKQPAIQGLKTVILDEVGFQHRGPLGSGKVLWNAFIRYLESKRHFLLYYSPVAFIAIPKRMLASDQLSELRRILKAHIG